MIRQAERSCPSTTNNAEHQAVVLYFVNVRCANMSLLPLHLVRGEKWRFSDSYLMPYFPVTAINGDQYNQTEHIPPGSCLARQVHRRGLHKTTLSEGGEMSHAICVLTSALGMYWFSSLINSLITASGYGGLQSLTFFIYWMYCWMSRAYRRVWCKYAPRCVLYCPSYASLTFLSLAFLKASWGKWMDTSLRSMPTAKGSWSEEWGGQHRLIDYYRSANSWSS